MTTDYPTGEGFSDGENIFRNFCCDAEENSMLGEPSNSSIGDLCTRE